MKRLLILSLCIGAYTSLQSKETMYKDFITDFFSTKAEAALMKESLLEQLTARNMQVQTQRLRHRQADRESTSLSVVPEEFTLDLDNVLTTGLFSIKDSLKPTKLEGISEKQIDDHWEIYKQHVIKTNALHATLNELRSEKKTTTRDYHDQKQWYDSQHNSMLLHEYYFGNLEAGHVIPQPDERFYRAIEKSFGSYEAWQRDFIQTAMTPRIGWVILYGDSDTGLLTNHFLSDIEDGHAASSVPLLVLDIWEHAYMVDHQAADKTGYLETFIKNIKWPTVINRFTEMETARGIQP